MSYELNTISDNEVLAAYDAELWSTLTGLDVEEEVFRLLTPSSETLHERRRAFADSGYHEAPDLRPDHADELPELEAKTQILKDLKKGLPDADLSDELRQAYRWRANEEIANLYMVAAAIKGQGNLFERSNHFIYGAPDPEVFAAVADQFCHDAEAVRHSWRPEVADAAAEVLSALGSHRGDKRILTPDDETFQAARRAAYRPGVGYMAVLMNGIELPDGMITAENGDPILRRMLANLGSDQEIADAPSWSNTPKQLRRPPDFEMEPQEFLEYQAHELSHAIERIKGMQSRARLMASGFDRYERGNEGSAVGNEQIANADLTVFNNSWRWQEILSRHLTVSLGSGLTGETMGFSDTHAVINAANRLYGYTHSNPSDYETAGKLAYDRTWDLAVGAYKGTNGDGVNGVLLRPKIYLEGNIDSWKTARDNPDLVQELAGKGKFDVSNLRHLIILRTVGALANDK